MLHLDEDSHVSPINLHFCIALPSSSSGEVDELELEEVFTLLPFVLAGVRALCDLGVFVLCLAGCCR